MMEIFVWLETTVVCIYCPNNPMSLYSVASKQNCLLFVTFLIVCILSAVAVPSVNVDLTQFTSGTGARFIGPSGSQAGYDVSIIGDHNGDGFTDYIFGIPMKDIAVIVMKRDTAFSELNVTALVSDQLYRIVKGPYGSMTGSSVGGIGDINGDGFDDVIVGAYFGAVSGFNSGYAFVIFGTAGPFTDLILTASWPASSLGFMILGPPSNDGAFVFKPRSAIGLGDVNADGIDDFAVSARKYKGLNNKIFAGVVWVIFGMNHSAFTTIDLRPADFSAHGVYYTGAVLGDFLGDSIAAAGDFNGDGIADFLMGGDGFDPVVNSVSRSSAGVVYLVHGSNSTLNTTDMSTFVTGRKGVRFFGAATNSQLGAASRGVGDVNGDGIDDIAIGASGFMYLTRYNAGAVYVIFGTTVAFTADVDLLNFGPSSVGFAIYGHAQSMQLCTAARVGDVDGDGVNDILIGGIGQNGRVQIVYGQSAVRAENVDLLTTNVTSFYYTDGAYLGSAMDGGKDLNGDGIPDILVSAFYATVTPENGGESMYQAGAVWMLPYPFIIPKDVPTKTPTIMPTKLPTRIPSILPSAIPSEVPSLSPTFDPTALPTADPSANPSMDPSAGPTLTPTIEPSLSPLVVPTVSPTLTPTLVPTVDPSAGPTVSPTVVPTVDPTTNPSVNPTLIPTATPTMTPTARPSVDPSAHPTVMPTTVPTAPPSVIPTARPTVAAVKDYEVVVDVEQDVTFINKNDYDAQKAACNLTIQHTVADATDADGIVPERVTDIVLEEEEEEGGRFRGRSVSAVSRPVRLKYKITINDPVLTVEKLRTQLVQAAREGKMERDLHYYAAQFGATNIVNGTFGEPQVTSAAVQRDASEQLTGVQIALVVIGVFAGLSILGSLLWFALFNKQAQPSPEADRGESA